SHYDVGETLQAAQMGATGALVGMGLGKLGGGLTKSLDARFGTVAGGLINAGLHGAATNVVTNAATGFLDSAEQQIFDPKDAQQYGYAQQKSGQNPLDAALNGAFTGMLFHGVHLATQRPITTFHPPGDQAPLYGVKTGDNSFTLFDAGGKLHGTGTL